MKKIIGLAGLVIMSALSAHATGNVNWQFRFIPFRYQLITCWEDDSFGTLNLMTQQDPGIQNNALIEVFTTDHPDRFQIGYVMSFKDGAPYAYYPVWMDGGFTTSTTVIYVDPTTGNVTIAGPIFEQ